MYISILHIYIQMRKRSVSDSTHMKFFNVESEKVNLWLLGDIVLAIEMALYSMYFIVNTLMDFQ